MAGDDDEARALADEALATAESVHHPQLRGDLLRYVQRAGGEVESFPDCPLPYALAFSGDFRGAAELWGAIGFPFEQALELADTGEQEAMAEAVAILDRLGAPTAAARVRLSAGR